MRPFRRISAALLAVSALVLPVAATAADQPNILVIWGDDVGLTNISYNSRGVMGYRTPNIDRIGNEGMAFTDYYGEQSCTAGRSSFIMGQSVFRTGLSKVGLPGAKEGMQVEDPTIAVVLKDLGYATGQFGKNHLGDRDEHLPTNHGFDEFFGNLYHLNAEEEPETYYYPKDPEFRKKFGPRKFINYFSELEAKAGDDHGFWHLPNGEAAYKLALRFFTTTSYTADEIHELGLAEVERIQAEILEIRAMRVREAIDDGRVVIVAGFQGSTGESYDDAEVTTLGRGGSDTTAVALAARLAELDADKAPQVVHLPRQPGLLAMIMGGGDGEVGEPVAAALRSAVARALRGQVRETGAFLQGGAAGGVRP